MTINSVLIFIAIAGISLAGLLIYAIYLTFKDQSQSKGGNDAKRRL